MTFKKVKDAMPCSPQYTEHIDEMTDKSRFDEFFAAVAKSRDACH